MNEDIKKLYDELINPQNGLSEDEFLGKLAKLESYTTINIYRTLLANKDKKSVRTSKEYRALKWLNPFSAQQVKEDNKIRNRLEKKAINNLVWEKVSISDIINIYSKNINKILKQKIDIRKKLKELNIVYDELEWTILPPEWQERIIPWSWKWVEEKEWFDRFSLLLEKVLSAENWFYIWDYRVVIWNNRKNMMRKTSYIVIEIPKINKTIFVNNEYWEATFIYDWIPTDSEIQEKWKQSYKAEFKKIRFLDPVQWVEQVKEALNSPSKWENKFKDVKASELWKYMDREEFTQKAKEFFVKNPEKKQDWLSADSRSKRSKLEIIIDWKTYKWAAIVSRIIDGINPINAKDVFISPKWYIEVLKNIFWEDDEQVNALITKIKSNLKEDFSKEEFIQRAREFFDSNPQEKQKWLSADSTNKRATLKIIINWATYRWAAIASRLIDGANSQSAKDTFLSWKWYIDVLKSLFWEDDEQVNALITKIKSNLKEDFSKEEFIQRAREFFDSNPQEKQKWLSADSTNKRATLKIIINWATYRWAAIASRLIDGANSQSAKDTFLSWKWYIDVLKSLFWEDDEQVNALITKIKSNLKEDFSKEEFIQRAREFFDSNPQEKQKWLSADSTNKRATLKIIINWATYRWAAIASRLIDGANSQSAKDTFLSWKWYIDVLKSLFWEDDEQVNALITKIKSNLKEDFSKEEFIQRAREFFDSNPQEKQKWLSADSKNKRKNLKIIINWTPYWWAAILSRLISGTSKDTTNHIFASPKWYINILRTIFWEDDEQVNALIAKIESNLKEDFSKEEFIQRAREFFDNNLQEKEKWLSADSAYKRTKLKIIINWAPYWWGSITSHLVDGIDSRAALNTFVSPKWYINILRTIFWEDDEKVNAFIAKIESNLKEDFSKEEFIQKAREFFNSNPQEKEKWLSADWANKRANLGITINWIPYKWAAILFRVVDDVNSRVARDVFRSSVWYIKVLKAIFWEDDPDVIKYINKNNLKNH